MQIAQHRVQCGESTSKTSFVKREGSFLPVQTSHSVLRVLTARFNMFKVV